MGIALGIIVIGVAVFAFMGLATAAQAGASAGPGPTGSSSPTAGGSPSISGVAPTSSGESAFIHAILVTLGAPSTQANVNSLAAWFKHEFPSWPPGAQNNPMATTLSYGSGATTYNSAGVKNYPTAAQGVGATAQTLRGYPCILAALKSGKGLCGQCASEFSTWSGSGYSGVC